MKSQFTPETQAAIIARLEVGLTLAEAAEGAGVKDATVRGWVAKGKREGEGPYFDFTEAVARVKNQPKIEAMTPEEHRLKVSEVARRGNVSALKLYWEIICDDRNADQGDEQVEPGSAEALDELAQRRNAS